MSTPVTKFPGSKWLTETTTIMGITLTNLMWLILFIIILYLLRSGSVINITNTSPPPNVEPTKAYYY